MKPGFVIEISIAAPGLSLAFLNSGLMLALPPFTATFFLLNGQPFFLPPLQATLTVAPEGTSATTSCSTLVNFFAKVHWLLIGAAIFGVGAGVGVGVTTGVGVGLAAGAVPTWTVAVWVVGWIGAEG